jgi:hypothetical protein
MTVENPIRCGVARAQQGFATPRQSKKPRAKAQGFLLLLSFYRPIGAV